MEAGACSQIARPAQGRGALRDSGEPANVHNVHGDHGVGRGRGELHIRDRVTERLTSALTASNPSEEAEQENESTEATYTSDEEVAGFNIIRAMAARVVDPKRVIMRDAKSYCAVLLDDNNRRTIARLHFNSPMARYLGTFTGKEEIRVSVFDPICLYKHEAAILARIQELDGTKSATEIG